MYGVPCCKSYILTVPPDWSPAHLLPQGFLFPGMKQFKGVWIPKVIWDDDSISWMDKCVLGEIWALSGPEGCTASNEYLADLFNVEAKTMANKISEYRKAGLIRDIGTAGKRAIVTTYDPDFNTFPKNGNTSSRKSGTPFPKVGNDTYSIENRKSSIRKTGFTGSADAKVSSSEEKVIRAILEKKGGDEFAEWCLAFKDVRLNEFKKIDGIDGMLQEYQIQMSDGSEDVEWSDEDRKDLIKVLKKELRNYQDRMGGAKASLFAEQVADDLFKSGWKLIVKRYGRSITIPGMEKVVASWMDQNFPIDEEGNVVDRWVATELVLFHLDGDERMKRVYQRKYCGPNPEEGHGEETVRYHAWLVDSGFDYRECHKIPLADLEEWADNDDNRRKYRHPNYPYWHQYRDDNWLRERLALRQKQQKKYDQKFKR